MVKHLTDTFIWPIHLDSKQIPSGSITDLRKFWFERKNQHNSKKFYSKLFWNLILLQCTKWLNITRKWLWRYYTTSKHQIIWCQECQIIWLFLATFNEMAEMQKIMHIVYIRLDQWYNLSLWNFTSATRTSNLRKLRTVLFVNEWILLYICVILSGDCVYSCSLLRRFAEICVFTNKFPYIRRNIFVAVYKRTEQSPHSERSTS